MESGVAKEEYNPPRNTRHSIKRALASYEDPEKYDKKPSAISIANGTSAIQDKEDSASVASDQNSEYEDPFAMPSNLLGQVWFILTFPINVAFYVTIPNTEKPAWENWYLLSFFMNILWIMAACLGMVHFATRIGCLLAVDPIVMGIVVLAAGTSVPDAIASMVVARQGFASMAIANALGSNVFDILLGLGLPWAIATAYFDTPTLVNNEGITIAILILLGTLGLFLVAIAVNKCYMNAKLGISFVALYAVYITYTIIAEQCLVPSISYKKC
jgi:Ca2+/Na+ antiporter